MRTRFHLLGLQPPKSLFAARTCCSGAHNTRVCLPPGLVKRNGSRVDATVLLQEEVVTGVPSVLGDGWWVGGRLLAAVHVPQAVVYATRTTRHRRSTQTHATFVSDALAHSRGPSNGRCCRENFGQGAPPARRASISRQRGRGSGVHIDMAMFGRSLTFIETAFLSTYGASLCAMPCHALLPCPYVRVWLIVFPVAGTARAPFATHPAATPFAFDRTGVGCRLEGGGCMAPRSHTCTWCVGARAGHVGVYVRVAQRLTCLSPCLSCVLHHGMD